MSTRCSILYFEDHENPEHTFHIYEEAFERDVGYLVDDYNRNPVRLSKRTYNEIVKAYKKCRED